MARFITRDSFILPVVIVVAAVALTSCGGGGGGGNGGGGGGGGGAAGTVVATSFQGFPSVPGGGLPPIFRDEVLLLTFDSAIDATIFGGFFIAPGTTDPQTFIGFSANNANGVPYFAYTNQAAAQQALQVFNDGSLMQQPGILGISSVAPNVLVFDPKVPGGNVFNLPISPGLEAGTQYDVFIPANSGLTTGGTSVPTFGQLPPATPPAFTPTPGPSTLLLTGAGFAPDTIPPQVLSITSMALAAIGGDPNVDPIPHNDTIVVTFSESIDTASINRQKNIIIRNTSVPTTSAPSGAIVPVTQVNDATATTFMFTPDPSFGAGPFTIQVEVGTNPNSADDILDLPSGPMGTQNSLSNSMVRTFTTELTPGQPTAASEGEDFETTQQFDAGFAPRFNSAGWNAPVPPMNLPSNQLRALEIDGSAIPGAGLGVLNPGMRTQFSISPQGVGATPPTLPFFSPFDDNMNNNLGMGQNPNGGSHTQIMYLTNNTELPNNLADSIELYEWGAVSSTAFLFTFNSFQMQMSHTSAQAANASSIGLNNVYTLNFDFDNPQNDFLMPLAHPNPGGLLPPNESPIAVVPNQPYMVGEFVITGQFIPFPILDLPFDFDDNRQEADSVGMMVNPSLVIDIDIAPPVMQNGNLILGTNVTTPVPTRRLIGPSVGTPTTETAFSSDSVIYHGRFTIAKKNSSARSLFYDLSAGATNPDYVNLDVFPAITTPDPDGPFITIKLQGADSIALGEPTQGDTGLVTYVNRDGMLDQTQLDALDGSRFFRVLFEFESRLSDNLSPFLNGFLLGFTF